MIYNTATRIQTVLGSVVTLVTALAVILNAFIAEVAPQLPDGWQDNTLRIGGAIVTVLGAAAAAVRRLTEVSAGERGLLPTPGRDHVPPS